MYSIIDQKIEKQTAEQIKKYEEENKKIFLPSITELTEPTRSSNMHTNMKSRPSTLKTSKT